MRGSICFLLDLFPVLTLELLRLEFLETLNGTWPSGHAATLILGTTVWDMHSIGRNDNGRFSVGERQKQANPYPVVGGNYGSVSS